VFFLVKKRVDRPFVCDVDALSGKCLHQRAQSGFRGVMRVTPDGFVTRIESERGGEAFAWCGLRFGVVQNGVSHTILGSMG
jgi:hypothetical protein